MIRYFPYCKFLCIQVCVCSDFKLGLCHMFFLHDYMLKQVTLCLQDARRLGYLSPFKFVVVVFSNWATVTCLLGMALLPGHSLY